MAIAIAHHVHPNVQRRQQAAAAHSLHVDAGPQCVPVPAPIAADGDANANADACDGQADAADVYADSVPAAAERRERCKERGERRERGERDECLKTFKYIFWYIIDEHRVYKSRFIRTKIILYITNDNIHKDVHQLYIIHSNQYIEMYIICITYFQISICYVYCQIILQQIFSYL